MSADVKGGELGADGLRELVGSEVAGLSRELCAPYDEFRSTVQAFRNALAGLERLCDAAANTLPDTQAKASASAAGLVDRLVSSAIAEAEASVQRARAELQREKSRLEDNVAQLELDLEAEREKIKVVVGDLELTREEKARAESTVNELRASLQSEREAFESQKFAARAELELERAEIAQWKQTAEQLKGAVEAEKAQRVRLMEALQTVQRAVSMGGDASAVAAPAPQADSHKAGADAPAKGLKLITSNKPAAPMSEADRELVEYLRQVFEQLQAMYQADLKTTDDSSAVVDRLTANLRHAQSVFSRRMQSAGASDSKIFEEQLAALLDAQSETSFGRHLAIAAYEIAGKRAEAS